MAINNIKRLSWLSIACVGIIVGAFYSKRELVCPSWSVTVIDSSGIPVTGALVRRECKDYSIPGSERESDAYTDGVGRAAFDGAVIRTHPLLRLAMNAFNFLTAGVHASYGLHAYVFAIGRDGRQAYDVRGNGLLSDWEGSPPHMESQLLMEDKQ